ncbi:MAG: response regulator [Dehalococcoidia bacterium]|nr:MAG: response regulator [Dehalococcoidia bacterium]
MVRNPRVIVIDQDQVARSEVQKMLALSGFAVLGEAGYGIEAVSLAKETEPDVVIVSIEEPMVRALQAVEAVVDLLPQSPVVTYSSITDPASMRKAMLAGVSDYLITPVREEELINSVHSVLAQEERRQARISGEMDEPVACGTVLTVFGAKGGIGKTTISTNLATALVQKTNQSVVVVDLDTRFGDVAILMDIPVERSIADLALPEEEINREILQDCLYTHNTGVTILPAPVRPTDWRHIHAGHIERVVTLLAQTYDYVILDTPGTFNDIVARSLELATLVLLVATVDMASLKDTLLAIDMLRSWNYPQEKVKLVINATNEASNVQPQEVKRMLGREVFWSIPYDRNISTSTQLGMPVVVTKPNAKASESLIEMAYALSGVRQQQQQQEQKQGTKGLFGRIFGPQAEEKAEVKVE